MNTKKIDKNMVDSTLTYNNITWYNALSSTFTMHGLLTTNNTTYSRLHTQYVDKLSPALNHLIHHPSGGFVSFITNSSSISVKVHLSSNAYMSHMSACGQCGLDLYCMIKNKYVFIGTTKINKDEYTLTIINNMPKKKRNFRLYLPIYIELKSLEIGVDSKSYLSSVDDIYQDKIVCYGTSITQGGCATRPGMSFSSIIGRNVPYEVYNLGFSGSCMLESSIANIIASINNVKYLIIEAEANAGDCSKLKDNLETFLNITSFKVKDVYLISRFPSSISLLHNDLKNRINDNYEFQKNICSKYSNVHFVDGNKLLKKLNYEETVDTVHLTDLGFYYVSKYFIKLFRKKD